MPDALELLKHNVALNAATMAGVTVNVAPCTWGDDAHLAALLSAGAYDVILCCEVVYQQDEDVLQALARTQHALAAPGRSKVLLAYEFRAGLDSDLAYFEAATELFGDSQSFALSGSAAANVMDHEDDGADDRFLYVYDVPSATAT